jgi:hypothetical protein
MKRTAPALLAFSLLRAAGYTIAITV